MLLAALETENKILLAGMGATFIGFALASSILIPRTRPNFPGHGLRWFLLATICLFVAMMFFVEKFAVEKEEPEEHEGLPALIRS